MAVTLPQGTRTRDEADNFLKALYGLTKMLANPNVETFLRGLDQYPSTTLGHLITFMQSFNLRFGVSKTPEQGVAYDQLYPLLVTLRDQANAQGPGPGAAPPAAPDPKSVSTFFSGMHFNHFGPQPPPPAGPVPAAPQPDNLR